MTNSKNKFTLLLLILAQISAPAFADEWSSGGGDPIENFFAEGRLQAADIVSRLSPTSLATMPSEDPDAKKIAEWVKQNKKALAQELVRMTLERAPEVQKNKEELLATCASTQPQLGATVYYHIPSCRGTVSSKEEAGKVLIHEAVHHFDIKDHWFAAQVAVAVYRAWENMLLNEVPFCSAKDIENNILASRLVGTWEFDNTTDALLREEGLKEHEEGETTWTFVEDRKAVKHFPGIGKCAYLAGWTTAIHKTKKKVQRMSSPFVVVDHRDNPTLVFDEDTDKDGTDFVTDPQGMFMMIARGATKAHDILFQGGDFNNQRLYAHRRKETLKNK